MYVERQNLTVKCITLQKHTHIIDAEVHLDPLNLFEDINHKMCVSGILIN